MDSNDRLIGGFQEAKEEGLRMLLRNPGALLGASTAQEVKLIRSENCRNLNNSNPQIFGARIINICQC